jgi:hypothetical protein
MGSYEEWDELIRGGVMWIADADPLAGRERIRREGSGDLEQMRALFRATFAAFGGLSATAVDMIERARHDDALLSAIRGIDSVRAGDKVGAQPLGLALRRWTGRVAGGLRLERAGETRAGVLWRVVQVLRPTPPQPPVDGAGTPPGSGDCGGRGGCGASGPRSGPDADQQHGGEEPPQDEGENLRNLRKLRTDPPVEGSETPAGGRCPDCSAPLSEETNLRFGGLCWNCRRNRDAGAGRPAS